MHTYFFCLIFYSFSIFGSEDGPWFPKNAIKYFNKLYAGEGDLPNTHACYTEAILMLHRLKMPAQSAIKVLLDCSPSKDTSPWIFWRNFKKYFKRLKNCQAQQDGKWLAVQEPDEPYDNDDRVKALPIMAPNMYDRFDEEVSNYTKRHPAQQSRRF